MEPGTGSDGSDSGEVSNVPDSKLVTKFIPAYEGNYTKDRKAQGGTISEITIHHCASILTIDALGALWQREGRKGSSHYGVSETNIGQYVHESDVAWTNGNWEANCRAVTIETSNGGAAPEWPVSDTTFQTLVTLVADIARRNGLGKLVKGKNLTWHSMYAATACPGPYLSGKLQELVDASNADNQIWQLCASQSSGGGSTGGSTTITMPVNANQNYSGNSSWIINYGCAVCCGVDLASWKKNKSYTISDFANYYDEANGYYWTGPDNFSCSDAISLASLNEAQTIEKIRSYVKNHIPVACHAVGSGSRQHWFVAYELTGESGGTWATAGIKVLDPYNSNSGSTEGRRVTILEAMQTSHVTLGVDRIRIPN